MTKSKIRTANLAAKSFLTEAMQSATLAEIKCCLDQTDAVLRGVPVRPDVAQLYRDVKDLLTA